MSQKTDLNFDFINRQPNPSAKKSVSMKAKVLVILLVMLLLVTVVGLFFGKKKTQTTANVDSNSPVNVRFMQVMSTVDEVNLAEAKEMLSDDLLSNKAMAIGAMLRLRNTIDFSTCKETETKQGEQGKTSHYYNCQTRDGNSINLEVINSDRIEAVRIEA